MIRLHFFTLWLAAFLLAPLLSFPNDNHSLVEVVPELSVGDNQLSIPENKIIGLSQLFQINALQNGYLPAIDSTATAFQSGAGTLTPKRIETPSHIEVIRITGWGHTTTKGGGSGYQHIELLVDLLNETHSGTYIRVSDNDETEQGSLSWVDAPLNEVVDEDYLPVSSTNIKNLLQSAGIRVHSYDDGSVAAKVGSRNFTMAYLYEFIDMTSGSAEEIGSAILTSEDSTQSLDIPQDADYAIIEYSAINPSAATASKIRSAVSGGRSVLTLDNAMLTGIESRQGEGKHYSFNFNENNINHSSPVRITTENEQKSNDEASHHLISINKAKLFLQPISLGESKFSTVMFVRFFKHHDAFIPEAPLLTEARGRKVSANKSTEIDFKIPKGAAWANITLTSSGGSNKSTIGKFTLKLDTGSLNAFYLGKGKSNDYELAGLISHEGHVIHTGLDQENALPGSFPYRFNNSDGTLSIKHTSHAGETQHFIAKVEWLGELTVDVDFEDVTQNSLLSPTTRQLTNLTLDQFYDTDIQPAQYYSGALTNIVFNILNQQISFPISVEPVATSAAFSYTPEKILIKEQTAFFNGALLAKMVDNDGSENLKLLIERLPVGSLLSDGKHSINIPEGMNELDIAGWDYDKLKITVPDGVTDLNLFASVFTTEQANNDSVEADNSPQIISLAFEGVSSSLQREDDDTTTSPAQTNDESTEATPSTDNEEPSSESNNKALTVNFAYSSQNTNEGNNSVDVNIQLNKSAEKSMSISYSVYGSAKLNQDHTLQDGSLIFEVGETSKTLRVNLLNDTLAEDTESIIIQLNEGSDYALGSKDVHTITLIDNDSNGLNLQVSQPSSSILPYNQSLSFSVRLDKQPTEPVQVKLTPNSNLNLGQGFGVPVNMSINSAMWNIPQVTSIQGKHSDSVQTGLVRISAVGARVAGNSSIQVQIAPKEKNSSTTSQLVASPNPIIISGLGKATTFTISINGNVNKPVQLSLTSTGNATLQKKNITLTPSRTQATLFVSSARNATNLNTPYNGKIHIVASGGIEDTLEIPVTIQNQTNVRLIYGPTELTLVPGQKRSVRTRLSSAPSAPVSVEAFSSSGLLINDSSSAVINITKEKWNTHHFLSIQAPLGTPDGVYTIDLNVNSSDPFYSSLGAKRVMVRVKTPAAVTQQSSSTTSTSSPDINDNIPTTDSDTSDTSPETSYYNAADTSSVSDQTESSSYNQAENTSSDILETIEAEEDYAASSEQALTGIANPEETDFSSENTNETPPNSFTDASSQSNNEDTYQGEIEAKPESAHPDLAQLKASIDQESLKEGEHSAILTLSLNAEAKTSQILIIKPDYPFEVSQTAVEFNSSLPTMSQNVLISLPDNETLDEYQSANIKVIDAKSNALLKSIKLMPIDDEVPSIITKADVNVKNTYRVTLSHQPKNLVNVTVSPSDDLDFGQGFGQAVKISFSPTNWNVSQQLSVVKQKTDSLIALMLAESHDKRFNRLSSSLQHTLLPVVKKPQPSPSTSLTQASTNADSNSNEELTSTLSNNETSLSWAEDNTLITEGQTRNLLLNLSHKTKPNGFIMINATPDENIDLGDGFGQTINLKLQSDVKRFSLPVNTRNDKTFTGSRTSEITIDSEQTKILPSSVALQIQDDEISPLYISTSRGNAISIDNPSTLKFSLRERPTAPVKLSIQSVSGNVIIDGDNKKEYTITPDQWSSPHALPLQTTYTPANNDSSSDSLIITSVSQDERYHLPRIEPKTITIKPSQLLQVKITNGSTLIKTNGTTDFMMVSLKSRPTSSVDIYAKASMPVLIDKSGQLQHTVRLRFNPSNWDIPQAISLKGHPQIPLEQAMVQKFLQLEVKSNDMTYRSKNATLKYHIQKVLDNVRNATKKVNSPG